MQTKQLYGVMVAVLAFWVMGCSQKAPDLPESDTVGSHNVSDETRIVPDTVQIDENRYGTQNVGTAKQEGVNYNSSADGFVSIYFDFDSYSVSPKMQERIVKNAQHLLTSGAKHVKIEGNCDEFGTDEYNYALGLKRAQAVKESLIANGVAPSKLHIVSFGESNPVCSEPTDTCYARNRRVDLRLVR